LQTGPKLDRQDSRPVLRKLKQRTRAAPFLPDVVLHGAFEADRQGFYDRGWGPNWLVSWAALELFNDVSDNTAQKYETRQISLLRRSEAQQESTGSAIRLQVRRAYADLRSAEQRIDVAKASVAEAEESLRITQKPFHAGMNNVTDLLRTETAVLDVADAVSGGRA